MAFLLALALVSCDRDPVPNKAAMRKNTPVLKIAILSNGRLMVDGAPSSIQSLRESLRKVGQEQGVVWYYRESGNETPPPIATEVINEVIEAGVPIRLSSKPDYSDSITSP
jgi:hypothetical protein